MEIAQRSLEWGPVTLRRSRELRFNLQNLPREIWISVFEAMEAPSDLLKVIRTCKFFYSLAVRVLYRDLHWMGPFLYTKNVPFWNRHPSSMALVPTSLTVSISLVGDSTFLRYNPKAGVVEEDGTWKAWPQFSVAQRIPPSKSTYKSVSFYASDAMYNAVTTRISTFKVLRELIFHWSDLPDTLFPTLKLLPRLRRLSIQYCTLPAMQLEPDPSFSELPLTELTLWYNRGDPETVFNSNYVYTLYLCTAKNLHTLRIDWTPVTGRFLSCQNPNAPIAPLAALKDVMIRFPTTKIWPSDSAEDSEHDAFVAFLQGSPGIERFACVNRKMGLRLPETVMPKLTSYSGTMAAVSELLGSRPVEHVELTDRDKRVSDVLFALQRIAGMKPRLQTLCFAVHTWDDEILYALASLFVDLRKIQVKFSAGFVPEQTLLSLGSVFLNKFPLLGTLLIFRTAPYLQPPAMTDQYSEYGTDRISRPAAAQDASPVPVPVDDDEEVKSSLNAWRKPCPLLRQVQLTDGFIWRRAFSGDEWCKRALPPANKIAELY
ncbi:hypothetical protein LshimejAT787_0605890 [Lyophyllum shimeji]|uniref:F-box domain-containing protein n=1 Tax=Lyophyllum shimeji TaxID=47721 RepID=A0A9P3PN45_LYOSH|nr:hypothetical protein LshimejAT787_0605890 [Lyophyllum shimeji]